MSDALIFEHEKHEYIMDDVKYPSVTQILAATGIIQKSVYSDSLYHIKKGEEIHDVLALIDKELIDEESPQAKKYMNYIVAYLKFKKDLNLIPVEIEMRLCSKKLRYAGTIDRVMLSRDNQIYIIDIKTGVFQPWHEIQLNAYEQLYREHDQTKTLIGSLYLNGKNANYKFDNYVSGRKLGVYNAALTIYNYLRDNKIIR